MSRDRAPSVHSFATPLLLFVAIGALGCSVNPAPGAHADDAPLDAWLPSGLQIEQSQLTLFRINKPAHVAIFDIRPGEGVRALYPWSPGSTSRLLSSGYHVVPGLDDRLSCRSLGASPIAYRFIVASEEPLQLEELRGDVGFRYVPGMRSRFLASGSPVRAMEAIVAGAVPEASSAPENADLAAYYSPYWAPACAPAVPTRIARTLALQGDRGAVEVESPSDDGRMAPEDVPEISVPRNPGDHRVRSPAAEGETVVTSGRLADVVSEAANSSLPETLRERLRPRVRPDDAGRGFRGFDRLPHADGFDRSRIGRSASSPVRRSDGIRNTNRSDARRPARRPAARPDPSSKVKPDVQPQSSDDGEG